jgi:hypothetical protein
VCVCVLFYDLDKLFRTLQKNCLFFFSLDQETYETSETTAAPTSVTYSNNKYQNNKNYNQKNKIFSHHSSAAATTSFTGHQHHYTAARRGNYSQNPDFQEPLLSNHQQFATSSDYPMR